jgi:hypothetical protein
VCVEKPQRATVNDSSARWLPASNVAYARSVAAWIVSGSASGTKTQRVYHFGLLSTRAFPLRATTGSGHRARRCFPQSVQESVAGAARSAFAPQVHVECVRSVHRLCLHVLPCDGVVQAFFQMCRSARLWCLWAHHIHHSGAQDRQAKKRC